MAAGGATNKNYVQLSTKGEKIKADAKKKLNKMRKDLTKEKLLSKIKLHNSKRGSFKKYKLGDLYRYKNNTIVVVSINRDNVQIPTILTRL